MSNKIGRPKISDSERRKEYISFTTTKEEKKEITQKAKKVQKSISEFVRNIVLKTTAGGE